MAASVACVGSVHAKVQYRGTDRAFRDADVPAQARAARAAVVAASQPGLLSGARPEWSHATSGLGEQRSVRRSNQISAHDPTLFRFSHRAEVLPKSDPAYWPRPGPHQFAARRALFPNKSDADFRISASKRVEEFPSHPRLAALRPWDFSSAVDAAALERSGRELHVASQRRSRAKSHAISLEGYVDPVQQQTQLTHELRKAKEARRRLGDDAKPSTAPQPDTGAATAVASVATAAAAAQSQSHRRKPTSRRYKVFYNDGVYEFNKLEGCHVWSCSMNADPNFRGSCFKVRNPDAWNFASP
jgi:hypothetical protein